MKKIIIKSLILFFLTSVIASQENEKFYYSQKLEYPNLELETLYDVVKEWLNEKENITIKLDNCNKATAKIFYSTRIESKLTNRQSESEITVGISINKNTLELNFNTEIIKSSNKFSWNTKNSEAQEIEFYTHCGIITKELNNYILINTI